MIGQWQRVRGVCVCVWGGGAHLNVMALRLGVPGAGALAASTVVATRVVVVVVVVADAASASAGRLAHSISTCSSRKTAIVETVELWMMKQQSIKMPIVWMNL